MSYKILVLIILRLNKNKPLFRFILNNNVDLVHYILCEPGSFYIIIGVIFTTCV